MERPITITVRHRLDRDALLDLRDDIIKTLAPLGISLEMTMDGTEVYMRHKTTPHFLEAIGEERRDPDGIVRSIERSPYTGDVEAAERRLNTKYGDPSDPEWKGDGCRG